MAKQIKVYLTASDRQELEVMIRSGSARARTLTKARILLLTDYSTHQHCTDPVIAKGVMCGIGTIIETRKRYANGGLQCALYDKPRPGAKPKITGEVEAALIVMACSAPPEGRTSWTLKLLAGRLVAFGLVESISDVAVMKRLKKTNLSLGKSKPGA
jgi:transposase